MRALTKILLRNIRRLWAQELAIALVLGCGVAIQLMSIGMSGALDDTRAAYYERNRFADVFSSARRAPLSLIDELARIPGVWAVEPRISGLALLDIPGRTETALGQIISLPKVGPPRLNLPLLRSGRWPDPVSDDEVMVTEPFAEANGFRPGDRFWANLKGRKQELVITGTVLSPEFIYTIGPGAMMPDNEGYGILWMSHQAAAAAFDMDGAFNDVSLKLSKGARAEPVIDAVDRLLEPYGGLATYDRSDQVSDAFIAAEIKQLKTMGYILPPIFFGITVFLLNMVISRIIELDRAQIGLLKANGYTNLEVSLHYIQMAALIAMGGIALGWLGGYWLARQLATMYAEFFNFPYLIFHMSPASYVIAALLGLLAAVLGAVRSAMRAAQLPPAVAMAPPAPPRFRRGLADRLLVLMRVSQLTMMILRSLIHWPVRSALTALGMALAVAVLIASGFFPASLDKIIDTAFYQSNRQDAILLFADDVPERAIQSVQELPGVMQAEGQIYAGAILRNGHLEKRVPVEARRPGTDLSRIIDGDGKVVDAPPGGIMLSQRLAGQLQVRPGDPIEIEFMGERREVHTVPVTGLVTQFFGLGAYMDFDALNGLLRRGPQVSVVNATLDDAQIDEFHTALKEIPGISGKIMLADNRRSFEDTIQENVIIMTTVYGILALLITVGVAYNSARVQLSERAHELASLRILGFSVAEVSYVMIGETMLIALIAQPIGWLLGAGIAVAMVEGFASDLYVIPLVLKPATFAYASLVVLGISLISVLIVRQRLDRLDLVSVMKTRE